MPYDSFKVENSPALPLQSSKTDLQGDPALATKDPLQSLLRVNETVLEASVNVSLDTGSNTADYSRLPSSTQSTVSSNSILETSSDSVTSSQNVTETPSSFDFLGKLTS